MSISDENENRAWLPLLPEQGKSDLTPGLDYYGLSQPEDDQLRLRRRQAPSSADLSFESSRTGSPLYMRNSRYPNTGAPATPANSPKQHFQSSRRQGRGSRQSLSTISNKSLPASTFTTPLPQSPEHPPSPPTVPPLRLSPPHAHQDRHAWRVINREIKEWQKVCQSGQPHWWHPTSRWNRRVRGTEQHIPPFSPNEWVEFVDDTEQIYYPGLCFEYEKKLAAISNEEDSYSTMEDLAFIIAVQLLGSCFTLPVDQFLSSTATANIFYEPLDETTMPNPHMISSLRMHTNYRWSPAFGYEQRTTSPESLGSNDIIPDNQVVTYEQTPDVGDSSWSPRKRKVHRIRNVTPANTADFDGWEDVGLQTVSDQGESPTTPTQNEPGVAARELRNAPRSTYVPGRIVQSAPPTPIALRQRRSLESARQLLVTREIRNEFPFPVTEEDERPTSSRYLLQPHLRSEPHPVFVQPVKELVVKRWRTFRRRFGHSMSHGHPDAEPLPSSAFLQEPPPSPWLPRSPPASVRAVKRRRDARSRHDIHSSSMESSPRFNTPTSGTPSGSSTPACEVPDNTPMQPEGNVDDLLAAARAITNSSSTSPLPDPQTAGQPFPVFTPNNTPSSEPERSPTLLPRNEAGFFMPPSPTGRPQFVPRRRTSTNRRSNTRKSTLSEVYPPEDKAKEITESFAARRHLQEAGGSILTTPTEESEGSDGSMVHKDTRRRLMGTDNDRPRELSKLGDGFQRQKEASAAWSSPVLMTPSEPFSSPSTFVIDENPFSFLVPKGQPSSRSRSVSVGQASRPRSVSMGMQSRPVSRPVSRMSSRRSHRRESRASETSNANDFYDPHAVDCRSNLRGKRSETVVLAAVAPPLPIRPTTLVEMQTEPVRVPTSVAIARIQRPRRTLSTPVDLRHEPDERLREFEEDLRIGLGRDRLQRVSTRGTTVYTPNEDGVEVDGLPVGPGVEMWDDMVQGLKRRLSLVEDGMRRRRKARSFL